MKILSYVVTALAAACLAGGVVFLKIKPAAASDPLMTELRQARESVQKRLGDCSRGIGERISAFAEAVGADREFAMKLLVENQRSAAEVTGVAERFIQPMGLSLLEVADSSLTLLSSGHFPACIGSSAADKAAVLGDQPVFFVDKIKGAPVTTLQTKKKFTVEEIPFWCMGGVVADEAFLAALSPRKGVEVLLKQGESVIGRSSITSMSAIKNNRIIIDGKTYLADSIPLPFAGGGDRPMLFVLMEDPSQPLATPKR